MLDLSQVVSGPICGRMLADLGADVVKVEPAEGDIIRMLQPQVGDEPVSVYFTWVNAGKRSISVDLRTDEGAELVRRLALTSDVLLDNFRPGVLAKFGLDAETLLAQHPRLDLLLDQRLGSRQLVVAAARVRARWCKPRSDGWSSTRACATRRPSRAPTSTATSPPACSRSAASSPPCTSASTRVAVSTSTCRWPKPSSTPTSGRRPSWPRYDGPRIPDTWNYPVFTLADGTAAAFMGDPTGAVDRDRGCAHRRASSRPRDSRDEALRVLGDLCAKVPDFATLEALFEPFAFLVAEVRTVAELAETRVGIGT